MESKFKPVFESWIETLTDMYLDAKNRVEEGDVDEDDPYDDPEWECEDYLRSLGIICTMTKKYCPELYDSVKEYESKEEVTEEDMLDFVLEKCEFSLLSGQEESEEDKLWRELIAEMKPELADPVKLMETVVQRRSDMVTEGLSEIGETEEELLEFLEDREETEFSDEENAKLSVEFKEHDAENHDPEIAGDQFTVYRSCDRIFVTVDYVIDCDFCRMSEEFQKTTLDILKKRV